MKDKVMHPFIVARRLSRRPKRRLVLTKLILVRFPPGYHYGSTADSDRPSGENVEPRAEDGVRVQLGFDVAEAREVWELGLDAAPL